MPYRLMYSQTSRDQIRSLHPHIKPVVKTGIQRLKENPFQGKALEKELSGYYSLATKRFRVIYNIDDQSHVVQIHYVGHRKDIYQLFKQFLAKL
ncbi:MAG: type II toxin-antitoxin system RelE/ParE family toxin [Desulfobacterales bacterium]|nr:type II toxin-antitoxin system RelE/ParE family toxin [Desulfobacterales bacterium]